MADWPFSRMEKPPAAAAPKLHTPSAVVKMPPPAIRAVPSDAGGAGGGGGLAVTVNAAECCRSFDVLLWLVTFGEIVGDHPDVISARRRRHRQGGVLRLRGARAQCQG